MRTIRVVALAVGWFLLLLGSVALLGAAVLAAGSGSRLGRDVAGFINSDSEPMSVLFGAFILAVGGLLLMIGALPMMFFGVSEALGTSPSVRELDDTPAPAGPAPATGRRVLARRH
jgi:hypothetical protein